MSPEPFKIGEVNNYFSQNDANSIFRADATDNLTEDQKEKKRVEIIIEDIEKRLKEQQKGRKEGKGKEHLKGMGREQANYSLLALLHFFTHANIAVGSQQSTNSS